MSNVKIMMNGTGKTHAELTAEGGTVRFFLTDGDGAARWTFDGDSKAADWENVIEAVNACAKRLVGEDVEFTAGPDADADVDGNRHVTVTSSQLG
jgi:hypothetical protein